MLYLSVILIKVLKQTDYMQQKKMLSLTLPQLKQCYKKELQELFFLAQKSQDIEEFRMLLQKYVAGFKQEHNSKQIRDLINYDGKTITELSTGKELSIQTLSLLRDFLTTEMDNDSTPTDTFIDLFYLFRKLTVSNIPSISTEKNKKLMSRWESGLNEEVMSIRKKNKERMIHYLIHKVEQRKASQSRFHFDESTSDEKRYELVNNWWNNYRFQLSMAIKSPSELNKFLGNSLSPETMQLLKEARKKGMPFFATPYYLSLLNIEEGYDDASIRSYILYSPELIHTYGNIRAWEKEDIVENGKPNAAGWLLPNGHNIHRRYPEVAILIPDTMGRACGGLCASCQRMYDFQSKRLNFEFSDLSPKESWDKKLRRLMNYFEEDTQLRDILITGGDALMSQNKTLRNILDAVYRMAVRKRKANINRPEGEKYAELQRVRLGSRLLAYLPMRIDNELVEVLKEFKEKASSVGVKQFIIQTHFQSPLEVTVEARDAINKILSAGWLITNQLVYTVAASRRGHTSRLRQVLNKLGVICYYTFSVKGFNENYAVFTPNSRSIQEQIEEKSFGSLTTEQQEELSSLLHSGEEAATQIQHFLKKHHLPFLATDRSVLNLPAIGKSMTFSTVGITPEGCRILKFDHDATRKHSPIIDQMHDVYITENKSIAAYLRQLSSMGEDPDNYATIWNYTEGTTESRFSLYEYPPFQYSVTNKMSNLQIEN